MPQVQTLEQECTFKPNLNRTAQLNSSVMSKHLNYLQRKHKLTTTGQYIDCLSAEPSPDLPPDFRKCDVTPISYLESGESPTRIVYHRESKFADLSSITSSNTFI